MSSNSGIAGNILSKRTQFFNSCILQSFSFRNSIINYILKNPKTPELYQKLIQSCKYFFVKNPILVVSRLFFRYKNEWYTVVNEKRIKFKNTTSKIWVTDEILIFQYSNKDSPIPSLVSQIYQSDIKNLNFCNGNISFNHLIFLASKCEYIWLYDITVIDKDNSVVSLENLIEVFPKLNDFKYYLPNNSSKIVTPKTVASLLKISNFSSFIEFTLENIPETFDLNTFYDFIKGNNTTDFVLCFCDQISEGCKQRLQAIVNEIKQNENSNLKVSLIAFQGMN